MTYRVPYYCSNCYFAASVDINKGIEAPLFFDCPNCGLALFKKKKLDYMPVHKFVMVSEWELKPL
jgi:hypothetical protein